MSNPTVRNVAIIAHVDHGKTTFDCLSNRRDCCPATLSSAMDSNDLEKERGITILAKIPPLSIAIFTSTSLTPQATPTSWEVERILSMVDAVLLLVDAVDGPMPQTRFVTQKAFSYGLKPIVVVNKIDRDGSDPYRVIDEVFDLFDSLGGPTSN